MEPKGVKSNYFGDDLNCFLISYFSKSYLQTNHIQLNHIITKTTINKQQLQTNHIHTLINVHNEITVQTEHQQRSRHLNSRKQHIF